MSALEHILHMWNPKQKCFEVGAHVLTIEVEDIYFLTGLLRQGAPISLTGSYGGDITTQELINRHCIPRTRTSGKKIPIKVVVDGPLRTVLFTMQRVEGSEGVHLACRAHILCMWNPEQQYFEVDAHVLTIEVEDIYFLIGVSRQGAPISLTGSHGGNITTQELINCHCIPGTRTSGKKIPIKVVVDGPLWTVLFTMQRVVRRQGVHQ